MELVRRYFAKCRLRMLALKRARGSAIFCANRLDSLNLDCMIPPAWYFKLSRKLRLCLSQVLATTHLNWFLAPNEYELFVLIGCSTEKTVRIGFIEQLLIGHLFFSQEMSWKVTQSTSWKAKISILEFVQVCLASSFFIFTNLSRGSLSCYTKLFVFLTMAVLNSAAVLHCCWQTWCSASVLYSCDLFTVFWPLPVYLWCQDSHVIPAGLSFVD